MNKSNVKAISCPGVSVWLQTNLARLGLLILLFSSKRFVRSRKKISQEKKKQWSKRFRWEKRKRNFVGKRQRQKYQGLKAFRGKAVGHSGEVHRLWLQANWVWLNLCHCPYWVTLDKSLFFSFLVSIMGITVAISKGHSED